MLDRSIFDFVDFMTNNIGMPIGALLISIFAGYYYTKDISRKELAASNWTFTIWDMLNLLCIPNCYINYFHSGHLTNI